MTSGDHALCPSFLQKNISSLHVGARLEHSQKQLQLSNNFFPNYTIIGNKRLLKSLFLDSELSFLLPFNESYRIFLVHHCIMHWTKNKRNITFFHRCLGRLFDAGFLQQSCQPVTFKKSIIELEKTYFLGESSEKRIFARIMSAKCEILSAGVQGPLKFPGSSRVFRCSLVQS